MSHRIVKRQFGWSRRKVRTPIAASRATWQDSSPWRISIAITAPGNAAERYSVRSLSLSAMAANRGGSAGEIAGALDLLLQQQHAAEQRFRRRRAARVVHGDPHDPVTHTT